MPAKTEPRSGLQYGWNLGESGWNTGMDNNLLYIGRFGFHLSVLSAAISNPPFSPADGASYIVAASPSGAWSGRANQIAVFVAGTPGNWVFATPRNGWRAWNEDTDSSFVFNDNVWTEQTSGGGAVESVNGQTGEVVLEVGDISGAVADDDSRLSDSREWTASTVSQAEAEAGTATTPRKWTAQRVAQAIAALAPAVGGGVPEAPTDGQQYARKDAAWVVVSGGGGSSDPASQFTIREQPVTDIANLTSFASYFKWQFMSRDGLRYWVSIMLADSSAERIGYYDQLGNFHFILDVAFDSTQQIVIENADGTGVICGISNGGDQYITEITAGIESSIYNMPVDATGFIINAANTTANKVAYTIYGGVDDGKNFISPLDGSNTRTEIPLPAGGASLQVLAIADNGYIVGSASFSGLQKTFVGDDFFTYTIQDTADAGTGTYSQFCNSADASVIISYREDTTSEFIITTDNFATVTAIPLPSGFTNFYSGGLSANGSQGFLTVSDGSETDVFIITDTSDVAGEPIIRLSSFVPDWAEGTNSTSNFFAYCAGDQIVLPKTPASSGGGGGGGVAGDDKEVQFNDGGAMGASPRLTFDKNTPTLHIKHIIGDGPPARLRIGTDYQYNGMYFQSGDGGSRQEFQIALSTDGGATDYRRILTAVDSSFVESSYNFVTAAYNNFTTVSAYQYYSQIEGNYDETPGGGTVQSAFALQSSNSYSRLQMNFNNGTADNTASLFVQPSNVQFQLTNAVQNTSASLTAVSFVAQFEAKLEGAFGYAVGGYVNPVGAEVTAKKSDNSNKASLIHTAGNQTQLLLTAPQTPGSSSATGTKGTIVWDDSYVYVCVDTDTWKRSPLSTW